MGLRDRLLDVVAGLFSPSMDHPGRGGMTGEYEDDVDAAETDEDLAAESDTAGSDTATAGAGEKTDENAGDEE